MTGWRRGIRCPLDCLGLLNAQCLWSHPFWEGDIRQEETQVGGTPAEPTHRNSGVHSSKLSCQPQVHSSAQGVPKPLANGLHDSGHIAPFKLTAENPWPMTRGPAASSHCPATRPPSVPQSSRAPVPSPQLHKAINGQLRTYVPLPPAWACWTPGCQGSPPSQSESSQSPLRQSHTHACHKGPSHSQLLGHPLPLSGLQNALSNPYVGSSSDS